MKKPGQLSCRMSHILNLSSCIFEVLPERHLNMDTFAICASFSTSLFSQKVCIPLQMAVEAMARVPWGVFPRLVWGPSSSLTWTTVTVSQFVWFIFFLSSFHNAPSPFLSSHDIQYDLLTWKADSCLLKTSPMTTFGIKTKGLTMTYLTPFDLV